jgi:hypothetical protein
LLRRATPPHCAGDFIEDDTGEYGQDLGEEEDWNRSEASGDEAEAEPERQRKEKKQQKQGVCMTHCTLHDPAQQCALVLTIFCTSRTAGKHKPKPDPGAKARLQKMFATAPVVSYSQGSAATRQLQCS